MKEHPRIGRKFVPFGYVSTHLESSLPHRRTARAAY